MLLWHPPNTTVKAITNSENNSFFIFLAQFVYTFAKIVIYFDIDKQTLIFVPPFMTVSMVWQDYSCLSAFIGLVFCRVALLSAAACMSCCGIGALGVVDSAVDG